MTLCATRDNVIHFALLVSDDPGFRGIIFISRGGTSNVQDWIARIEGIIYLVQDEKFVISMV